MSSLASLARDFARALDRTGVMVAADLPPDPWQTDLLNSDSDRHLVMCSRQAGKSTTVAALALNQAFFDPGLVLLIAPAQRQSVELFRKVKELHSRQTDAPKIVNESALRLELDNGSRIVALPGTEATIRGYSAPRLIVIDEASRVEDSLFTGVRPMLATNEGRMILLSTPYGRRGFFYECWSNGEGWQRTCITANDCPRISPDWLENERRMMGEWQYRQEFLCQFVDVQEQFFSGELIEAALRDAGGQLWI
jgi:hypothetical protein